MTISWRNACASGSTEPSHVLRSIGLTHAEAMSSLRFTIGHDTTLQETEEVVRITAELVSELRKHR